MINFNSINFKDELRDIVNELSTAAQNEDENADKEDNNDEADEKIKKNEDEEKEGEKG